jgi:hypothetical protein
MKPILTTGPGLLIGLPTLGRPVPLDWALAFKALNPPINFNIYFSIIKGQEIGIARNEFAKQALHHGTKYLFMLGDDVEVPAHTLRKLLFRMENTPEIDVVGGVYCSKSDPPAPLVFKGDGAGSYWDWKVGEFFECTGMGMDCTLIRTSVFEKLTQPWFKTVDKDQFETGINAAEAWTEDLFFFRKLRDELPESKIFCDASVICKHHDVYGNKVYTLPANSYPLRQKIVHGKKCLMIGGPKVELNIDLDYDIVFCSTSDQECDYRILSNSLPFDDDQFDWVIVTDPVNRYDLTMIQELLRVSKGKISLLMHEMINPDFFSKSVMHDVPILKLTQRDGAYLELIR